MTKRADRTGFRTASVTGSAVGRVLMTVAVLGAGPVAAEAARAGADAKAAEAFAQLLEAYRARPALSVESTLRLEIREGDIEATPQTRTARFTSSRTDGAPAGRVTINDFTCSFRGGELFAVHEGTEDLFYREEYDDSPYWSFLINFKDIPYPHLAILFGEEAPEDVWMQLFPETPNIEPTGVESVEVEGRSLRQIVLSGPEGAARLFVEPRTQLLWRIEHEVTAGPTVAPGTRKLTTYTFEYDEHDAPLPAADLAFDPGDRQRVNGIVALLPPPPPRAAVPAGAGGGDLVGKPAPPFTLATADGKAIDLERLRGKVVVLDFWATWCGPCRRALPLLHDVASWAREEDLPVEIITVNVWESRDPARNDPDARLASVRAFWDKNGYTLPVAMDYTDETAAAYGVTGIPATFVLRADGIVHAQPHVDVERMKQSITDAIEVLEAPADDPADNQAER